jgi:hypothetical protein
MSRCRAWEGIKARLTQDLIGVLARTSEWGTIEVDALGRATRSRASRSGSLLSARSGTHDVDAALKDTGNEHIAFGIDDQTTDARHPGAA